nr:MAG TPA: hypothetical protein [Caudoviricetes sp.]
MDSGGFNPRTPCGVRRLHIIGKLHKRRVSIHALLAECDDAKGRPQCKLVVSIHALLAECDHRILNVRRIRAVSIHALLAECDKVAGGPRRGSWSFNPRTPCGVRLDSRHRRRPGDAFQSTHSLRSATPVPGRPFPFPVVSIHALLAECDKTSISRSRLLRCFNPRTPCGVRQG